MVLLITYLALALGVSFLCSLAEAGLLSVPLSHARVLADQGRRVGQRLEHMKRHIDRPLAAILTLNTIAHTVGAIGVGAQSKVVFGDEGYGVFIVSAVTTVLVLVVSEIIPKTLGAVYAVPLAAVTVQTVRLMIGLTIWIIIPLDYISKLIKGSGHGHSVTREQLAIAADFALAAGQIDDAETQLVRNALNLRDVRVRDVMTPRTVVHGTDAGTKVSEVASAAGFKRFSRIPIFEGDHPIGIALRYDIYEALRAGQGDRPIGDFLRSLHVVPDSARLTDILDRFGSTGHHMFQVADEHGTFEGLVTLEDVLETMLGREIIDETDPVEDMRDLAAIRFAATRDRPVTDRP
jgi:CBS domain containing-hemolysin-like protein